LSAETFNEIVGVCDLNEHVTLETLRGWLIADTNVKEPVQPELRSFQVCNIRALYEWLKQDNPKSFQKMRDTYFDSYREFCVTSDFNLATGDEYDVSFLGTPHRHIFHFNVAIEVFHNVTSDLLLSLSIRKAESQKLTVLQDTLIPKLFSGEIDLSGVSID